MARAVETHWPGPLSGLVVTRYGHAVRCERIEVVEASHPLPDAHGLGAAQRILGMVGGLTPDDLVICLISGGGSALLTLPAPGIPLDDKIALTRALLRSGARIDEMNAVRKHLSGIKGGRLAAAAFPARILTLAISDVPGDSPDVIASGPTVADPSTFADAREVLARYGVVPPVSIRKFLDEAIEETPKPDDPRLAESKFMIVAKPKDSLEAAAALARSRGVTPILLGDALEGEARKLADEQARIALSHPTSPPIVILSGGETTVTVQGPGRGGRNSEFALALASALNGAADIHAIACDTDGTDGTEDNAGVIVDPTTLERARKLGMVPAAYLADNNAYSFFRPLDDLVVTGPTLTNVNDFRAILIGHPPWRRVRT